MNKSYIIWKLHYQVLILKETHYKVQSNSFTVPSLSKGVIRNTDIANYALLPPHTHTETGGREGRREGDAL